MISKKYLYAGLWMVASTPIAFGEIVSSNNVILEYTQQSPEGALFPETPNFSALDSVLPLQPIKDSAQNPENLNLPAAPEIPVPAQDAANISQVPQQDSQVQPIINNNEPNIDQTGILQDSVPPAQPVEGSTQNPENLNLPATPEFLAAPQADANITQVPTQDSQVQPNINNTEPSIDATGILQDSVPPSQPTEGNAQNPENLNLPATPEFLAPSQDTTNINKVPQQDLQIQPNINNTEPNIYQTGILQDSVPPAQPVEGSVQNPENLNFPATPEFLAAPQADANITQVPTQDSQVQPNINNTEPSIDATGILQDSVPPAQPTENNAQNIAPADLTPILAEGAQSMESQINPENPAIFEHPQTQQPNRTTVTFENCNSWEALLQELHNHGITPAQITRLTLPASILLASIPENAFAPFVNLQEITSETTEGDAVIFAFSEQVIRCCPKCEGFHFPNREESKFAKNPTPPATEGAMTPNS